MKVNALLVIMAFIHLLIINVKSQNSPPLPSGSVILNESSEIRALVNAHATENGAKKTTEGFRVQILSESGNDAKKKAVDAKTSFLMFYPAYTAYLIFQTPNFKIRIGDFRTKLEAYHCQKDIQKNFPNAFIVKDDIQFPSLDN